MCVCFVFLYSTYKSVNVKILKINQYWPELTTLNIEQIQQLSIAYLTQLLYVYKIRNNTFVLWIQQLRYSSLYSMGHLILNCYWKCPSFC